MVPSVAGLVALGAFVVVPTPESDVKRDDVIWWMGKFRAVVSWKVEKEKGHRLYHLAAAGSPYSKAFTIPLKTPMLVLVRPA